MENVYIEKSIDAKIDSVDVNSGVVVGYFSVFNNVDSDGDVIRPGAFTKTLQEFPRVRHLWQHNPGQPLARPELNQDNTGLRFKSTITPTSFGKDVLLLYKDEVVDEHSIGAYPVKRSMNGQVRELLELQLFEGSTVTWGANDRAIGGMLKSALKLNNPEDIIKRMARIYKAIRNGRYENEETFELLDIHHKQLQQLLIDVMPSAAGATTPQQISKAVETKALSSVLQNVQQAEILNNLQSLSNTFNYAF